MLVSLLRRDVQALHERRRRAHGANKLRSQSIIREFIYMRTVAVHMARIKSVHNQS